ncbi:MAG: ABC transporter substrate-binding protein [Bacillota bacterium]|jgi:ABC-type nitrate/sulfonate/bicarbonate transport system substrate-binding protein
MKKIFILLLTLILVGSLTACTSNSENEQKTAQKSVTVVLDWTPNTNHTGLYVALEKDYFAAEGLDVEIIQPPEDGAAPLVAAGKAQFGVDFQDYLAPAFTSSNPLPVTAIAALVQHNTSGIISLQAKNIKSGKDLMGKKYATWDLPVEKAMLKRIVENDGGDFSQIELVPSTVTDVISALDSDIDAVWIFYAWDGIACQVKGIETNFFAFKDEEAVFDYYTPVLIANDQVLTDDPELAKAFLRATAKGYQFAIDNPQDSAAILLKYAPELDAEIVLASQQWLADKYLDDAPQWGFFSEERWDAFYNYLYQEGLIAEEIPAGTGFTNDYLPTE